MSMNVYQNEQFSNNPMLSHEKAIKWTGKYLYHTNKEGMVYTPYTSKGLECYVNVDFSGGWLQSDANNIENITNLNGHHVC